jgi:serine O-acetyltransferase
LSATASGGARPQADVELGRYNNNPRGCTLLQLVREDLATHDGDWLSEGFHTLAVHRFGNWRMSIRSRLLRAPLSALYTLLHRTIHLIYGIELHYTVKIGRRVRIWHSGGMTISAIAIGDETHLRQNITMGVRRRGDPRWERPTIGARCDIGAGAVLVGGILVGDDCVIGANVVIAEDVPPGSIVTVAKPVIRPRQRGIES